VDAIAALTLRSEYGPRELAHSYSLPLSTENSFAHKNSSKRYQQSYSVPRFFEKLFGRHHFQTRCREMVADVDSDKGWEQTIDCSPHK
jgi:hypothetical protein